MCVCVCCASGNRMGHFIVIFTRALTSWTLRFAQYGISASELSITYDASDDAISVSGAYVMNDGAR